LTALLGWKELNQQKGYDMKPSTIKQNYRLAKLLEVSVIQVMLACLSSATAWKLISKIEEAHQADNQPTINNIKNAIIYGTGSMRAFS